jgi:uncharacterized cupin superfamily protein
MCETTVGCDETGIWREDRPGYRTHLPWSEITRVTAGKLDCITRVDTVLEFDHESGHLLEINNNWAGFDTVVEAVGKHYSLPADWYAAAEKLGARDDAIVVWQRAD